MSNFVDFMKNNLMHVAPILIAGGFAVAIVLERLQAIVFRYPLRNSRGFFDKVRDLIMADRLPEAIALCDQFRGKLVPGVVREGLLRAHEPEVMIEDGLDLAISDAMLNLQKRTQFLATIANISTLLGLLGTIAGLIQSFEAVGSASAQQRASMLAAGISTAMNATMLGLAIAIPCMVAFSYLMNHSNRLAIELDRAATQVLDLIRHRHYASEAEVSRGGRRSA